MDHPAGYWVSEWMSDGHLLQCSLTKLKKRRLIPLPAIASCEWLSGLGLVQGLLMVLSVSVKYLSSWVPQGTPSSKVWLELGTRWMHRRRLGCHGCNQCNITNTVHVLRGSFWRCFLNHLKAECRVNRLCKPVDFWKKKVGKQIIQHVCFIPVDYHTKRTPTSPKHKGQKT